ncbi:MAG: protein-disulfide reductase DsbD family protein [Planctomycetota bacterium]|nr:protein-disulfide reductase DsbD family protein [Planctomycetota bacterium]
MQTLRIAICLLALTLPQLAASEQVTAELHLSKSQVVPGGSLVAAVHLRMAPGWHVYWRNPGDSGLPTNVTWGLPPGFTAGELRWPTPQRFEQGGLVSFGYGNELWLTTVIQVPDQTAQEPVTISANLRWLACLEACVPGSAALSAPLSISDVDATDASALALEQGLAAQSYPSNEAPYRCTAHITPNEVTLKLHPLSDKPTHPASLSFYPASEGVIQLAAAQRWTPGPIPQLTLQRAAGTKVPEPLEGLLVADDDRAWHISASRAQE